MLTHRLAPGNDNVRIAVNQRGDLEQILGEDFHSLVSGRVNVVADIEDVRVTLGRIERRLEVRSEVDS